MNYRLAYKNIIDRARNRILEGYVERHHVIPRSLGGTDNFENIICLTAREHFVAHLLLAKIHGGKMIHAAWMMSNLGQYTNKKYEWIKKKHAKAVSIIHTGKIMLSETKKKIGAANRGRKKSDKDKKLLSMVNIGNKNALGYKHTDEAREKMRLSHLGKKFSKETREKMSLRMMDNKYGVGNKNHLGKKVSAEAKEIMRKIHIGEKHSTNHKMKTSDSLKRYHQQRKLMEALLVA